MSRTPSRIIASLHPAHIKRNRTTKRVLMDFCEDNGFVYFGQVHHNDDELQIVRGMTLSQKHRDNHYCVGSIRNYDLTIVERTDVLRIPSRVAHDHRWLVFCFALTTTKDLPHVFLGHNQHSTEFYEIISTKFDRIQRAAIGTFGAYDPAFTENYSIFTKPAHALDGERLFDQSIAQIITKHFGKLSVELVDNRLYIYADKAQVTAELLDTMLKNGVWLADAIDKNADKL